MELQTNYSMINTFILLGFQNSQHIGVCLFILILVLYILTLCGNLLIIILVSYSQTLHSPMYFFLTQLSISDILLTTDISPNLLYVTLQHGEAMTFTSCIVQYYFFVMTECSECLLLMIMSYDRYLAICNPLHYVYIMNRSFCIKLVTLSWLFSIFTMMISTITIAFLDFCGPNIIDHIFCDVSALLKLSCSDTFLVQLEMLLLSVPVLFLPFLLIMISYTYIAFTILKIPTETGKEKAFSTCSSHLSVVSIFYITLIVIYDLPSDGQSLTLSKTLSLLYTVGTPLINPIIYSLRNKEIKKTFKTFLTRVFVF
ncbi:olfactory receptor 11L1-like [Hyperolius riggenbachi]|uniref:olfactory receptor 11L1-like n=1 Tax=Hyperolius riggenbachi TaxID=752182 RepID=UPI0035A2A130